MNNHSEFKAAEKAVFRLQQRIYKATARGDLRQARNLQKLLLNSHYAKILAVRQVTTLNEGKKTAGIDGKVALTVKERLALIEQLGKWKNWEHNKLRKVLIPKKNGKTRTLKVPTIADRAYQCLVKMAIEPAHESQFHKHSYGFRAGRSAHDAQKIAFINLNSKVNGKDKRVLELDIKQCFDRINHKSILTKIIAPTKAIKGIKLALKAGINPEFPEQGTPQGGVISPLLANIALNGIENVHPSVRYADDMILFLKPKDDAKQILEKLKAFLAERGLEINQEKTKVTPTTNGFDFLGWKFTVKPNGKLTCNPSKESKNKIVKKIKEVVTDSRLSTDAKVKKLAPIVRGWRNYHQYTEMKDNLWSVNNWTWRKLNKNKNANRHQTNTLIDKAFPTVEHHLFKFVNVKGNKSPYDGDLVYWAERNSKQYNGLTAKALKRQGNNCGKCGHKMYGEQPVHLHHINGNHSDNKISNLVVLHKSCHIETHSQMAKGLSPNFIGSVVR